MFNFFRNRIGRFPDAETIDRIINVDLAGVQHHDLTSEVFRKLRIGDVLKVVHCPDNPHDSNALEVRDAKDRCLGFIPRVVSQSYAGCLEGGKHVVAVSKLEKIQQAAETGNKEILNIGVGFPVLKNWKVEELAFKATGCLRKYDQTIYLYTDRQLGSAEKKLLEELAAGRCIESAAIRLLEVAPGRFHDFRFKYRLPSGAGSFDVDQFSITLNDRVGIIMPLSAFEIERAADQKWEPFFEEAAQGEAALIEQIRGLRAELASWEESGENLQKLVGQLQEESDLLKMNA